MHPQVLALNNLKMEVKSETSDDSSSGSSSPTSSNSSSDSDDEEETSYWPKCRAAMTRLLRHFGSSPSMPGLSAVDSVDL